MISRSARGDTRTNDKNQRRKIEWKEPTDQLPQTFFLTFISSKGGPIHLSFTKLMYLLRDIPSDNPCFVGVLFSAPTSTTLNSKGIRVHCAFLCYSTVFCYIQYTQYIQQFWHISLGKFVCKLWQAAQSSEPSYDQTCTLYSLI